jgi:hypothetical protein
MVPAMSGDASRRKKRGFTRDEESSSQLSARDLYTLMAKSGVKATPPLCVLVAPNEQGALDDAATRALFDRIWKVLRKSNVRRVVLDMADVRCLTGRFVRELVFLKRHLPQLVSMEIANPRPEYEHLLDLEQ